MSTVFMHIIRVRTFKVQVKCDKLGTKKYNYKIKMKKKKEGGGGLKKEKQFQKPPKH